MSDSERPASGWRNLRQHPAFQAAAVYVGGSWAVIQVADIFIANPTVVRWIGIILAAGFLAVVGGAWLTASRGAPGAAAAEADAAARAGSRRRRRRLAYAAAVALVAVGGVFWWLRPNILGAVAPDAQVIAVLPFNTSGPDIAYLGEGMVDLLSTNLDEVGAIRTVDSRTVLHRWRQRAAGRDLDFEGSLAVGREVNSGSVLLGSVVSAGGEVRLTAELHSVRGGKLAQAQVEGPAEGVLALVDSLGLRLLREIWIAREPVPNLRVSGITTGDLDAIRAYLRGQQFYRRSRWDSAIAAFQQAVDEDSTFALAHYRLGLAYGWSIQHGGFGGAAAKQHGRLAQRYADRLPSRERTLIAANNLFEDADLAALDTVQAYVRRHPDDPEGWYLLGDVRYHAKPLLALPLDAYFEPFDRVLELDPTMAPAMVHPLELSLIYGDSAKFFHYLGALEAVADPTYVEPYRILGMMFSQPDSAVARLAARPDAGHYTGFMVPAVYNSPGLSPDLALRGITKALEKQGQDRVALLGVQATILASLGQLEEARQIYDTLRAIAPTRQESFWSLAPVIAGYADSSFGAPALQAMREAEVGPAMRQLLDYTLMTYELSRGRPAEARRLAAKAAAADTTLFPGVMPHFIEAGLGWAEILEGDTIGGLAKLEQELDAAGYAGYFAFSQPQRFLRAAVQAARPGTRQKGIERLHYGLWFGDVTYFPLAYLALGQALEAEGDAAAAAKAYTQFIHLWENADPELQPRVETARRALERLRTEGVN